MLGVEYFKPRDDPPSNSLYKLLGIIIESFPHFFLFAIYINIYRPTVYSFNIT